MSCFLYLYLLLIKTWKNHIWLVLTYKKWWIRDTDPPDICGNVNSIIDLTAMASVHSLSQGNPQIIDALMTDTLVLGAQMDKKHWCRCHHGRCEQAPAGLSGLGCGYFDIRQSHFISEQVEKRCSCIRWGYRTMQHSRSDCDAGFDAAWPERHLQRN